MTAIHQQIVLIPTRTGSIIGAWDVETGTHIASFKDNASGPDAVSLLGQDYLVAAQAAKGALHFWTWHKDAVLQRCYAVEPIVAIACSPDGVYCAGGGQSGTIYLWEVPSGRLLRSWPAHYKAVTVLRFSGDGSMLLSGGEDTVASAWLVMDLLDASASQHASHAPQPFHSWQDLFQEGQNSLQSSSMLLCLRNMTNWRKYYMSQHTLPVTSIHCGRGSNPVVVTTSLDQSCKVYSLATGSLLRSMAFSAALHSAVMDPAEHSLHAGSADGRIFHISLVGGPAEENAPLSTPAAADISMQAHEREWITLEGHTRSVTSLAYTIDGMYMLSGSEDGTVRVWEVRSSQCIRIINAPDKAPVTGLIVLDRPAHLASGQGRQTRAPSSDAGAQSTAPKRPQPLAPFCKFLGMQGALQPWEGPPVVLDGSHQYRGQILQTGLLDGTAFTNMQGSSAQSIDLLNPACNLSIPGSASSASAQLNESRRSEQMAPTGKADAALMAENERLKQQLLTAQEVASQWQDLHRELHKFCVDKVIAIAQT